MDYNLAALRQRVMVDKLDDDEYEPQVIDNFINDTQRDIFNTYELPFMEKIFTGSIPNGSIMFAMPSDVALIQSQVITAPDGSQKDMAQSYMDFRTFNKRFPTPGNNRPGSVDNWTLYAGNVLTSQPTDTDYTMTMFYIRKPKTLTQNIDVPEIPEEFSEVLVLGALMRVHARNEDYDLVEEVRKDYNKIVGQIVDRYGLRTTGVTMKMKNRQIKTRGR